MKEHSFLLYIKMALILQQLIQCVSSTQQIRTKSRHFNPSHNL